jgi:hypothetical protein
MYFDFYELFQVELAWKHFCGNIRTNVSRLWTTRLFGKKGVSEFFGKSLTQQMLSAHFLLFITTAHF